MLTIDENVMSHKKGSLGYKSLKILHESLSM